ncbi:nickel transporter, partial [Klebsiella aerogenes]|nr:nickel transporter [Klebsiella aerogenes]
MSVVFTPRARAPRWKSLWPLALFLTLTVVGGIWLWLAWPQVLLQSAVWQRSLNLELSQLLQAVADNPSAAGLSLLGFSFVYGVLHALGPGHGKIVITTWLATPPSKLKSSITLTLAASLLQGMVAIVLVVVVLTLLQLPARQLHLSSFWLEKGSYLLV